MRVSASADQAADSGEARFPSTSRARQPVLEKKREQQGEAPSFLVQAAAVAIFVLGSWVLRRLRKPKAPAS